MALDKEASVETEKAKKLEETHRSLVERQEFDYAKYTRVPFTMPPDSGKWKTYTANYARVLADYVVGTIAAGKRRVWIPLDNENKRKRDSQSDTERFATGIIRKAEQNRLANPYKTSIQGSLAWYGALRGLQAMRFYMWEDDAEVVPDLDIWDPMFTNFIVGGRKGLSWASYKYWASEQELEIDYPEGSYDSLSPDPVTGLVCVRNVIDGEESAAILDASEEYLEAPWKHHLDHIPVYIRGVGHQDYVQSQEISDTIKDWAESIYAADRDLFDIESELWTYFLTSAQNASKEPEDFAWDSSKGGAKPSAEEFKNANVAGSVNFFDKAKGQEKLPPRQPPKFEHVTIMLQGILEQLHMGGIPPVAQGVMSGYLPAEAVSLLTHSAQARIKPVLQTTEQSFIWLAREAVSQYVDSDFGSMELEGVDRGGHEFSMEIEKKRIVKAPFTCEIKADLPQDKMRDIGIAAQGLKDGIFSPQKAMDISGMVEDTDQMLEQIEAYRARQKFGVADEEMLAALYKDDPETARRVEMRMMQQVQQQGMEQPGQPGAGNQPGIPSQPDMTAQVMGAVKRTQQVPVPPEIQAMARRMMAGR